MTELRTKEEPLARFNCTNGGAQYCYGCYTMERDDEYGDYMRFEDHERIVTDLRASLRREENARAILADENTRLRVALAVANGENEG